jgi:hypothetical protein
LSWGKSRQLTSLITEPVVSRRSGHDWQQYLAIQGDV